MDVPFRELSERHVELILHGVPERKFGGLDGFFAWLERRKYKMHIRVFLEPLAELSALSGLRRHAAAARGPGGADRRQEHRRNLRHEGPRRRRVLPRA